MKVSNWGKYPSTEAEIRNFSSVQDAMQATADWENFIPRGLGRCYGDSALSSHILSTLKFDRFLDFDAENGILHCQAGLSLEEILKVIVPKGWFLPVTPGTKFVTLGGAIAADVHGKNHHSEGSFSRHLISLNLLAPNGEIYTCSREENAEIFWATCGGMGLTGIILDGKFSLKPIETVYIVEEATKTKNVDELYGLFEESKHFTYSVAWIDCLAKGSKLGKGILLNGEHALKSDLVKEKHKAAPLILPKKRKLSVPFNMPSFTINPLTVKAFNTLFYGKAKSGGTHKHIIDYDTYFYPLDGIHHWNRVYGKKGFAQYQFVIPPAQGYDGMLKILNEISKYKLPSFLTVLKSMGPGEKGMLAFPMEGYTLALDFPINQKLFGILDRLDEIVRDCGGRIYLTKDSRMKPGMFEQGYPQLADFLRVKSSLDANGKLASMQSNRLIV